MSFTPIATLLLLMPVLAHTASFDCKKASTSIERMICANPQLSNLDSQLSVVYEFESSIESVRTGQRAWLVHRNHCQDEACLTQQYQQRILKLCDEATQATGAAIGVNACTSVEIELMEQELGFLEQQQQTELLENSDSRSSLQALIAEERKTWRAYRNAQCLLQGSQEGGIPAWQAAYANSCMLEQTKARIKQLKP